MFYAPALRTRAYAPAARGFDRGFERFLNEAFFANGLKVEQTDAAWTITLDLPGVAREQLKVDIEGAVVRLETAAEAKRSFKAAYELPEEIDADASAAQLENGVLTLTLGKKKPVSNARSIEVK
jgi:HSP20 family molecular chaperone IbpA